MPERHRSDSASPTGSPCYCPGVKSLSRQSTLVRYGVLSSADIVARVMGFVATILIVRTFSDAGFGKIGVANSVVTYALIASTYGLNLYAVRRVASAPGSARETAATVIALRLILGIVGYALLLAVCALVPQLRDILFLVSIAGLTLFSGAISLTWLPQALQRTRALAAANFATQALYLLGVFAVVTLRGPLWAVPLSQVGAECVVAAALFVSFRRSYPAADSLLPKVSWGRALRQSLPMGLSGVMRTVALGCDLVLLRLLYVSEKEIGWYNGALRLFALMMGLTATYFLILFPRLVQKHDESPEAFRHTMVQSLWRVSLLAGMAGFVLIALAPQVLLLLFAPAFVGGTTALRWLTVAALAGVVGGHFRNMLLASNRQRTELGITSASAAVHVVCKIVLISRMGIDGAALGGVIGELAVVAGAIWATRRDLFAMQ